MKRIFIIGNSIAAAKTAQFIRQEDSESELTIISTDGQYPYEADRLAQFVSGEISQKDVLVQSKDFYDKNKIKVVLDKNISKINLKRSRLFTEQKDQWEYDCLVLADLPGKKFPDIKGSAKEGIYNFRSLPQAEQLIKKLLLIETVAVRGDSFEALEFALALKKKGKEVFVFVSENSFWMGKLTEEHRRQISDVFSAKGFYVFSGNDISEILGDSDVKAVRLKSGKVLAAQMIVFEDMREDWRIFSENELQVSDRFEVDEWQQTSVENVYALFPISKQKNAADVFTSYAASSIQQIKQAQKAASKITGKEIPLEEAVLEKMISFEEVVIYSTGEVKLPIIQPLIAGSV